VKLTGEKLTDEMMRADEHGGRDRPDGRRSRGCRTRSAITVHDVGEHQGAMYIAMELVDGATLSDWQQGRPWREIADSLVTLAIASRALGRADDAAATSRRAIAILDQAGAGQGVNGGIAHLALADALRDRGKLDEARAAYEAAGAVFGKQLGEAHPLIGAVSSQGLRQAARRGRGLAAALIARAGCPTFYYHARRAYRRSHAESPLICRVGYLIQLHIARKWSGRLPLSKQKRNRHYRRDRSGGRSPSRTGDGCIPERMTSPVKCGLGARTRSRAPGPPAMTR
jgi:hypothetical protein